MDMLFPFQEAVYNARKVTILSNHHVKAKSTAIFPRTSYSDLPKTAFDPPTLLASLRISLSHRRCPLLSRVAVRCF